MYTVNCDWVLYWLALGESFRIGCSGAIYFILTSLAVIYKFNKLHINKFVWSKSMVHGKLQRVVHIWLLVNMMHELHYGGPTCFSSYSRQVSIVEIDFASALCPSDIYMPWTRISTKRLERIELFVETVKTLTRSIRAIYLIYLGVQWICKVCLRCRVYYIQTDVS